MQALLKTAGVDLSNYPKAKKSGTGSFQSLKTDVTNTPSGPSIRRKGGLHGTRLPKGGNGSLETNQSGGLSSISLPSC